MDTLRQAIKEAIKKRQIKVSELTKEMEISQTYYYSLMNGRKRFNESIESKLCDVLGIEISYNLKKSNENSEVLK